MLIFLDISITEVKNKHCKPTVPNTVTAQKVYAHTNFSAVCHSRPKH